MNERRRNYEIGLSWVTIRPVVFLESALSRINCIWSARFRITFALPQAFLHKPFEDLQIFHKLRSFCANEGPTSRRPELSGGSPALAACIRFVSEIPTLVIDAHRCHVITRKRNFLIAPNFYNATLTYDNLIKGPAVLEFHRDNLKTDACLSG